MSCLSRVSIPVPAELIERWNEQDATETTRKEQLLQDLRNPPTAVTESKPPHELRDLRGIVLRGENLQGLDLSGCDLSDADLREADLREARLTGSLLKQARLAGAQLDRCEFQNANLEMAHLEDCSATNANFTDAILRGADLYNADFTHSTFVAAELDGADMHGVHLDHANLRRAQLRGVDLSRSHLEHANLTETTIQGAVFHRAKLQSAQLWGIKGYSNASFIEADIREINLSGASGLRRHILDENFLYEFRQRGRAHRILYFFWWLTSDCGRSLTRWFGWSCAVVTIFAVLYSTTVLDYGPHATSLSPFYFSLTTFTTLGFGDVIPASLRAQMLTMSESIIGYTMFAGLLSILVTKMTRRG